jgi:hypothetical protein
MKGESENDLDLYFIAAEEKTSAVHAQSCVDAVEKTLAGCGKTRLRLIMLSRFGDYVAKGRVLVASAAA